MPDANLIAFGKVGASAIRNKRSQKTVLRSQLRDEIDKLALFIRELKLQADSVQRAADALGDELLSENSGESSEIRVNQRDGHV